jgi:hypothetical protein
LYILTFMFLDSRREFMSIYIYIYIECSLCRLIRRPEHLIDRDWDLPSN